MHIKLSQLLDSGRIINIENYLSWCDGLLTSPASKSFHGDYQGGLIKHCNNVYTLMCDFNKKYNFELDDNSIVIVSYFHDLCKVGKYIVDDNGNVQINYNMPKGHALLSIERIFEFMTLHDYESDMIKYHMGMYGTIEFNVKYGEYTLRELEYGFHDIRNKMFYFCDDMAAHLLED